MITCVFSGWISVGYEYEQKTPVNFVSWNVFECSLFDDKSGVLLINGELLLGYVTYAA